MILLYIPSNTITLIIKRDLLQSFLSIQDLKILSKWTVAGRTVPAWMPWNHLGTPLRQPSPTVTIKRSASHDQTEGKDSIFIGSFFFKKKEVPSSSESVSNSLINILVTILRRIISKTNNNSQLDHRPLPVISNRIIFPASSNTRWAFRFSRTRIVQSKWLCANSESFSSRETSF